MSTYTTAEVAELLRISPRKVRTQSASIGIGINVGGKAGYRYTQADVDALIESMRPPKPVATRRRRRSAA